MIYICSWGDLTMGDKRVLPTPPKDFRKLPPKPFPQKEMENDKRQEVAESFSATQNSENLEKQEQIESANENKIENTTVELENANITDLQPAQEVDKESEKGVADENSEEKKEKKKINLKPLWWVCLIISVLLGFGLIFLLIFFE